jgi:hypothetical protein
VASIASRTGCSIWSIDSDLLAVHQFKNLAAIHLRNLANYLEMGKTGLSKATVPWKHRSLLSGISAFWLAT